MKRLLLVGSAVLVAAALAACGDSNGPGLPSSVALFVDSNFVDYDTSDYGSEGSELQFTLESFGIAVDPVTAYDSAAIAAALNGNAVFIVPERQTHALADSLPAASQKLLRDFVDSSGGTLVVTADDPGLALLDSLFGFTITGDNNSNTYTLDGNAAAGTPFAGGPALVWDNDGTYTMLPASLPGTAKAIYQSALGEVAVATIPRGRGHVVIVGWDWYNAAPHGSQDGGWIEMLRRSLRF